MADKGKVYPVNQLWRVYAGNVDATLGLPPLAMRFHTQFWKLVGSAVASNVWIRADPMPWSPGDAEIGYQSAPFTVGSLSVQVGALGKVLPTGFLVWKVGLWDSGVDQIPWGYKDSLDHVAWWPGWTDIWFTDPAQPGTILPNGVTSVQALVWADF